MNYFNTSLYQLGMYQSMVQKYSSTSKTQTNSNTNTTQAASTDTVSFSDTLKKTAVQKESVVDKYKREHPKEAWHVENQVRAGQRVLAKNNAEAVSREDMTMDEYKQFFTELMDSIPYDISQQNDVNVWNISDKGWEQMKNDPSYEAWVLGYTAEDRSVHNPFASMMGYSPNYHTERFGASIEEHLGQSGPMGSSMWGRKVKDDDEESWWVRRSKMMALANLNRVRNSLFRAKV
ncbi:MAG: hypothetical protein NC225_09950 [Clostridium sp.]|nr:hypothetical protein [Clostridium sp.]MCM1399786.1 hypothetical protein [Clostridium sp.]MCM1459587.1 hypothetical protein [Bacteroides sp.]